MSRCLRGAKGRRTTSTTPSPWPSSSGEVPSSKGLQAGLTLWRAPAAREDAPLAGRGLEAGPELAQSAVSITRSRYTWQGCLRCIDPRRLARPPAQERRTSAEIFYAQYDGLDEVLKRASPSSDHPNARDVSRDWRGPSRSIRFGRCEPLPVPRTTTAVVVLWGRRGDEVVGGETFAGAMRFESLGFMAFLDEGDGIKRPAPHAPYLGTSSEVLAGRCRVLVAGRPDSPRLGRGRRAARGLVVLE